MILFRSLPMLFALYFILLGCYCCCFWRVLYVFAVTDSERPHPTVKVNLFLSLFLLDCDNNDDHHSHLDHRHFWSTLRCPTRIQSYSLSLTAVVMVVVVVVIVVGVLWLFLMMMTRMMADGWRMMNKYMLACLVARHVITSTHCNVKPYRVKGTPTS